jgi:hypothetical protein
VVLRVKSARYAVLLLPARALACLSILLMGAAAGCSSAAPAPGAATNPDYRYGVEDPTAVSCPSATFCMAVLESGYAATYDGTTWSRPTRLSSSAGEPDSVSCPTVNFCLAVDARDSSAFAFNGGKWSSAPRINDLAASAQPGMASVSCSSPSFCAAVDNGANAFTFNGATWAAPVTIDSKAANSDRAPVLIFLMSVSCRSARFCVAGDSMGDAFVRN